jgi:hypothetical protein
MSDSDLINQMNILETKMDLIIDLLYSVRSATLDQLTAVTNIDLSYYANEHAKKYTTSRLFLERAREEYISHFEYLETVRETNERYVTELISEETNRSVKNTSAQEQQNNFN